MSHLGVQQEPARGKLTPCGFVLAAGQRALLPRTDRAGDGTERWVSGWMELLKAQGSAARRNPSIDRTPTLGTTLLQRTSIGVSVVRALQEFNICSLNWWKFHFVTRALCHTQLRHVGIQKGETFLWGQGGCRSPYPAGHGAGSRARPWHQRCASRLPATQVCAALPASTVGITVVGSGVDGI